MTEDLEFQSRFRIIAELPQELGDECDHQMEPKAHRALAQYEGYAKVGYALLIADELRDNLEGELRSVKTSPLR